MPVNQQQYRGVVNSSLNNNGVFHRKLNISSIACAYSEILLHVFVDHKFLFDRPFQEEYRTIRK